MIHISSYFPYSLSCLNFEPPPAALLLSWAASSRYHYPALILCTWNIYCWSGDPSFRGLGEGLWWLWAQGHRIMEAYNDHMLSYRIQWGHCDCFEISVVYDKLKKGVLRSRQMKYLLQPRALRRQSVMLCRPGNAFPKSEAVQLSSSIYLSSNLFLLRQNRENFIHSWNEVNLYRRKGCFFVFISVHQ